MTRKEGRRRVDPVAEAGVAVAREGIMLHPGRSSRAMRVALVVVLGLLGEPSALGADPPAGVEVRALPEALTKESVRDLLSRLSDQQVRGLLIEQLDSVRVNGDVLRGRKNGERNEQYPQGCTCLCWF